MWAHRLGAKILIGFSQSVCCIEGVQQYTSLSIVQEREKVDQTLFIVDTVNELVLIYLSTESKKYSKIPIIQVSQDMSELS